MKAEDKGASHLRLGRKQYRTVTQAIERWARADLARSKARPEKPAAS